MKISCLINNYNYSAYVCEAIQSVLDQSQRVDEIIVVDDGSTDGSCERIEDQFHDVERVVLIRKENAGQLSCFNQGMQAATGELVFFLDADDRYRRDYVAQAKRVFELNADIDFLSVTDQQVGADAATAKPTATRDLGVSTLAALLDRKWIGGVTSSLSMRSSMARRVLPCALESEWRTRADDVLVFGSSIVGAHKFHLGEPLVEYRVHGSNHFAGKQFTPAQTMRYSSAVNRLIAWYGKEMGYDLDRLPQLLHREFRTLERPSYREWSNYLSLVWRCRTSIATRLQQSMAVTGHAIDQRLRRIPARNKSNCASTRSQESGPSRVPFAAS